MRTLFFLLVLFASAVAAVSTDAVAATVDSLVVAPSAERRSTAERFLRNLQRAVRSHNNARVSAMIRYPLNVNGQPIIDSPEQFLSKVDELLGVKTRQAILAQRPGALLFTLEGVSIGNGIVWFDRDCGDPKQESCKDSGFQIRSINE